MPGTLWAIAEAGPDGHLTKLSSEVATLVRGLGAAAGRDVAGLVVGAPGTVAGLAAELAAYLPRVVAVEAAAVANSPIAALAAQGALQAIGADPDASIFMGNFPDGRDTAGFLMAALGVGVISNAGGVTWDSGPVAEKGVFGGRLITTSSFADGHGIVTVPLGSVPAETAASAGAVEHLLVARVESLADELTALRLRGIRVVGAEAEAAQDHRSADLRGPICLVIGSEGKGLSPAIRRRIDLYVRIPMVGKVASLNASVAGSILLFEVLGQRPAAAAQPVPATTPAPEGSEATE